MGRREKKIKGLNNSPPPQLKEIATKSIYTLKEQQRKLDQASFRLKERDRILYENCIGSIKKNNKDRASICANELAEVRKLLKFLSSVNLAIERVVLRLETLREFSEIVIDLKPALKLLQGVSQELIQVLPDVSAELNEVNSTINDTLGATKLTSEPDTVITIGRRTEGGDEIIKEVSTYLQQKVAETLPEPPIGAPNIELKRKAPPLRELVALGASSSHAVGRRSVEEPKHEPTQTVFSYKKSEVQEISLTVEKPSIEDMLLEYVRKSNGEIDLTRCSSELNTSNQEIEKALESLGNKGRIKIELKSPE